MRGTIQNREPFLQHVAKQFGRDRITEPVERPVWNHQPQWEVMKDFTSDQLMDVLEEQCKSIHTTFQKTTKAGLEESLVDVLDSYDTKSLIRSEDIRFLDIDSSLQAWADKEDRDYWIWNPEQREESIKRSEQATVGLTFSDITLSESGTVVLFSSPDKGRSVSLLPENYIALIPKSTLVPRMSQATRMIHEQVEEGADIASCINFITGPSNSADIEMNLVVGVHGPVRATYIVIEDM